MSKVIAVGQSSLDILFAGQREIASFVGGRIANMAVSLSRAGVPVEFVSECATDGAGDKILDFLQSEGVGVNSVDRFTEGQTQISVIFRQGDEPERYSRYVKYPDTRFNVLWPRIEENDILVFGSYFALEEEVRQPLSELLEYARDRKALIVYLPGFPDSLCKRVTHVMPSIIENLEAADIVMARQSDLVKIFSQPDAELCYKNHIRFYSDNLLFIDTDYRTTLFTSGRSQTTDAPVDRPVNPLGWNASFIAGTVYAMLRQGISLNTLSLTDDEAWRDVLLTAQRFAADSRRTGENFISTDLGAALQKEAVAEAE